jgi:predicted metal-dependent hydrolase
MIEAEIATVAAYMFDRYLDRHWKLRFVDEIRPARTKRGRRYLAGHTSWDQRIIRLSRMYIFDYTPEQIGYLISHEVAHALTPEDWVHGPIFRAKLEEIRRNI